MATTLVYTVGPYVPFTKILSANANQDKTDIQNRINWAGGTDTATGLGDDNIQSNAASGGGLTRATKLKKGTANFILVNDGTGAMSELNTLDLARGGTGIVITPGSQQAGDVLQINVGLTGFTVGPPTAIAASLRLYQFTHFT